MNKVTVNGKTYKVIKNATDDIETTMIDGNIIEFVSGIAKDEKGNRYEIDWYIDYDTNELREDASDWVSDWDMADEAHLMED